MGDGFAMVRAPMPARAPLISLISLIPLIPLLPLLPLLPLRSGVPAMRSVAIARRVIAIAGLVAASAACRPTGARAPERRDAPGATVTATPAIDGAWMRGFVERFADDGMTGRFTLDPASIDRAATALAHEYAGLGLAPVGEGYRVPFEFSHGTVLERAHHVWVEATGPARALPADQITTLSNPTEQAVVAELVFAGPRALAKPPRGVSGHTVLARDPGEGTDTAGLRALAARLASQGARALLLVGARTPDAGTEPWPLPVVALGEAAAASMATAAGTDLAALASVRDTRALAGVRVSLAPRRTDRREHADNVLAWIPGTETPDEIVMLGAHYDHIGTTDLGPMCRPAEGDTVCNGADDNASGTAMVLGIARAMHAVGYRPRRTIVFAHFAGEELGLHGSKALADAPPKLAPLAGGKLVAMINFDMVGRLGEGGMWVGGVGTSAAWMPLLAGIGTRGIPTVFERSVTARSDHASFYAHDIPVLFFFTGLHGDYHRPGDEIAAMNFEGMATIGQIALELAVALGDGAPIAYAPPGEDEGLVSRLPGSDARSVEPPP